MVSFAFRSSNSSTGQEVTIQTQARTREEGKGGGRLKPKTGDRHVKKKKKIKKKGGEEKRNSEHEKQKPHDRL